MNFVAHVIYGSIFNIDQKCRIFCMFGVCVDLRVWCGYEADLNDGLKRRVLKCQKTNPKELM